MKKIFLLKNFLFLILILPILGLLYNSIGEFNQKWFIIILKQFLTTIELVIYVVPITTFLGFLISFIITRYKIPGIKLIKYGYIYGLTLPAYILALIYTEFGIIDYGKIGLVFILILSTLPFAVLSIRNGIKNVSFFYEDISLNLGLNKKSYYFKVFLPLLKPVLFYTIFIITIEIISEFGATYFMGINTFITGLYDLWFVGYKTNLASQISIIFYLFLGFIIYFLNIKDVFYNKNQEKKIKKIKLSKFNGFILSILAFIPLIFILVLPIFVVIKWILETYNNINYNLFFSSLLTSLTLGIIVSLSVIIISLLIFYIRNNQLEFLLKFIYLIPNVILAISILIITPFVSGFILNYITLLYALIIKYLALGYFNIKNAFFNVNKNLIKLSNSFGKSNIWHFLNIDLVIIKRSLLLTFLLVFIEIIKELPITLTLAPFGFKTISMNIFFSINSERIPEMGFYIGIIFLINIIITHISYTIYKKISYKLGN